MTFIGLVAGAIRYRINKIREVDKLRVRIATDLHDDVGSNLSSIALASKLLMKQNDVSGDARSQLQEISQTAVNTSQTMRDIVWLISPENDTLEDFVLKLRQTAERMVKGMEYSFNADIAETLKFIPLQIKRNIFLCYKEALNNIIKHSRAKNVFIAISFRQGVLALEIKDDGIGFDVKNAGGGFGMNNLAKRMEAVKGTLSITSKPGTGTAISLRVKIG